MHARLMPYIVRDASSEDTSLAVGRDTFNRDLCNHTALLLIPLGRIKAFIYTCISPLFCVSRSTILACAQSRVIGKDRILLEKTVT